MDVDLLDAEVGGPMGVRHLGEVITLPAATDLHWSQVLAAASNVWKFMSTCWPPARRLPYVDLCLVQEAWRKHNGLPDADQCGRLAYMVDRYRKGIEYDLRNHLQVSLGELWRARRWRELLVYIDMLPTNSHMHRLLTTDEEYMERVMESKQDKDEERSGRPSMADWSMTNSLLAQLVDAVNRNTQITVSATGSKQNLGLSPVPRPWTAADKVNYRIQQRKHEEMKALLLRRPV
jgi:hypothetical protein